MSVEVFVCSCGDRVKVYVIGQQVVEVQGFVGGCCIVGIVYGDGVSVSLFSSKVLIGMGFGDGQVGEICDG